MTDYFGRWCNRFLIKCHTCSRSDRLGAALMWNQCLSAAHDTFQSASWATSAKPGTLSSVPRRSRTCSRQPCPPIWLATNPHLFGSPQAGLISFQADRVARLADGWMTIGCTPSQFERSWSGTPWSSFAKTSTTSSEKLPPETCMTAVASSPNVSLVKTAVGSPPVILVRSGRFK